MKDKIINVNVFCFADGTTFHSDNTSEEYAQKVFSRWWETDQIKKYSRSGIAGGIVQIKMFEQDYIHNIKATNGIFSDIK
jgi:hypothetical protein